MVWFPNSLHKWLATFEMHETGSWFVPYTLFECIRLWLALWYSVLVKLLNVLDVWMHETVFFFFIFFVVSSIFLFWMHETRPWFTLIFGSWCSVSVEANSWIFWMHYTRPWFTIWFLGAQCLWKLTRQIPDSVSTLNLDQLLLDIHQFMTGYQEVVPSPSAEDYPFRTVKTVLYHLTNTVGPDVRD